MTRPTIEIVFSLLDQWRHLPAYQLERRADVFFGLFLPDVLDDHLRPRGLTVDPRLIPEFPLRQESNNRSDKADYFALATDGTTGDQVAFLVELKTDIKSQRDRQNAYLVRAEKRGMRKILHDLKRIFKATSTVSRGKYFHLLRAIAELGLVSLPSKLEEMIYHSSRGLGKCIDEIQIASTLPKVEVLYILPEIDEQENCIEFERVARVVEGRGDIGRYFATYVREWARQPAGSEPR